MFAIAVEGGPLDFWCARGSVGPVEKGGLSFVGNAELTT